MHRGGGDRANGEDECARRPGSEAESRGGLIMCLRHAAIQGLPISFIPANPLEEADLLNHRRSHLFFRSTMDSQEGEGVPPP